MSGFARFRGLQTYKMGEAYACFPGSSRTKVSQTMLLMRTEGYSVTVVEVTCL